jgi:hypothetical protein
LADRLRIAGVAIGEAIQPSENHTDGAFVLQARPPLPKGLGLLQFKHV